MLFTVTPLAGVWIEIGRCGLVGDQRPVTPLAGVWIEITGELTRYVLKCHSPRGSVD